jgi:hypothetical protein
MSIGMWVLLVLWCGVVIDTVMYQRKMFKWSKQQAKELANLRDWQTRQLFRDLWLIDDVADLKKRANENNPKYSRVLNDLFAILEKYGEKGKSHGSTDA